MPNNFPTLGNSAIASKTPNLFQTDSDQSFFARVIDVSIEPSGEGQSIFQTSGGWASIGCIKFETLNRSSNQPGNIFPQGNIAIPLDNNIKKIPALNEIVLIYPGPSTKELQAGDNDTVQYFYSTTTVWNRSHINMLPSINSTATQTKDNIGIEAVLDGIENTEQQEVIEPLPGKTLAEQSTIRNLYPVEGDVLIEGRFGNSLRFSSTAKISGSTTESPWSTEGSDGKPITILRNGQGSKDSFNNWFPIYEDIQTDNSSIYLTSGQTIPIALASTNFASFGADATPVASTTKLIQEVPLNNPNIAAKDADTTGSVSDIVNVEPDLTTENTGSNGG
tara:strand:+ start:106 stop:1110 length:1005 start_codon:yes stop_codon:yes gene_type:complete